jgi:pimeloyl-ACP methyl ester carboxylesterase
MWPLAAQLRRSGHRVYRARLPPLCVQDVRLLATHVERSVAEALRRADAEQVDLVGVSQGGLAALYYLRRLDGHHRVRRLVSLGTPFAGTWFAVAGLPLLGAVSRGVWQSLPDSDLVRELISAGPAPGEDVVSVARAGDPVAPPARCRLEGARHVVLPPTRLPGTHQTLGFHPVAVRAVVEALAQTDASSAVPQTRP